MSACSVCGRTIPKEREVQKRIYKGLSVSGFNSSSNILLNWGLNSLLNRRPIGVGFAHCDGHTHLSDRNSQQLHALSPRCRDRIQQPKISAMLTIQVSAVV
jgi:hypothetical protein